MLTNRTALPLSSSICSGERLTIERVLAEVAGVLTTMVNPVSEMAYVEYDPARTDPAALFAVLQRSGFAPADRVAVRRDRFQGGRMNQTSPSQGAPV